MAICAMINHNWPLCSCQIASCNSSAVTLIPKKEIPLDCLQQILNFIFMFLVFPKV